MSNFNVVEKHWIDVVFENRNQSYGAYQLRNDNSKSTIYALLIGLSVMSLLFLSSFMFKDKVSTNIFDPIIDGGKDLIEPTVVVLPPKSIPTEMAGEEVVEKLDEKSVSTVQDVRENIKFVEMEATIDENVSINELASQNQFSDEIQSGQSNLAANVNGSLNTSGMLSGTNNDEGNKVGSRNIASAGGNEIVRLVQVKALPKEGYESFFEVFSRKLQRKDFATSVNQIIIKLKFVVEKDGSFSDIQILQDQNGLGKEAVKVLQSMPLWQPAKHNGQTVRSSFVLPIKINVNN